MGPATKRSVGVGAGAPSEGVRVGSATQDGFVQAVRDAVDIERVISEHVNLRRSGRKLKGLCPFHTEKTPSFVVDPEKQLFYCFGCQVGGDTFKFVMLTERFEFPEALRHLASQFGVPVPQHERRDRGENARLLDMHNDAAALYRRTLSAAVGAPARAYLEARGLDQDTVSQLGLGFAPPGWDHLRDHLRSRGYKDEELVRAGLAVPRRQGSGCYDRFRDRLVFPIERLGGGIIGFGGRCLGDDEPKYLNSPDSPIFNKGRHLYGLAVTREAIREADEALIVEGYMDLAALWQAGVRNAVAVLGTGFTPEHARLLGRFTRRVVLAFDPDRAGRQAAERAIPVLLRHDHEVRVLDLPEGKDPDDVVREEGAEAFHRRVAASRGCIDFFIDRAAANLDLSRPEIKARAVSSVLPQIADLGNRVLQAAALARVADHFDLPEDVVHAEFHRLAAAVGHRASSAPPLPVPHPVRAGAPAERRLLHLLIYEPELRGRLLTGASEADFAGLATERLFGVLLAQHRGGLPVSVEALQGLLPETEQTLLIEIAMEEFPGLDAGEGDACWKALRRERLERESHRLQRQLQVDDPGPAGGARLDDMLRRKLALRREIDALS